MYNLEYPIVFSIPERVAPTHWGRHVPFAMFLVDVLRPRVLVELGTLYGVSYCAFCQAVKELKINTRCYAVDTWEGDAHQGNYSTSKVLGDLMQYHEPRYGGFSSLLRSTFDDATKHFQDGEIDLLHIDGYHTYDAVKHDFETWLPKMSERGVILFHDINERQRDFGVWRFWEEAKKAYPSFEMLHEHGLGVLAVGQHVPEKFRQLILDQDEISKLEIRDFFFQQGNSIAPLFEVYQKEIELKTLRIFAHQKEQDNRILNDKNRIILADLQEMQSSTAVQLARRFKQTRERFGSLGAVFYKCFGWVKSLLRKILLQDSRASVETVVNRQKGMATFEQAQEINDTSRERTFSDIPELDHYVRIFDNPYSDLFFDMFSAAQKAGSDYVSLSKNNFNANEALVKLIAFYLPQYHPIPENDEWWGKGFTEWANVTKALPQFIGHYQPHLPGELGFYDLRIPEVQRRQVELARQYGIYGFCFYYYWFNGKRLLERPIEQFMADPQIDFPFCACWVNENWTRRWDSLENEVLISQVHTPESDFDFIQQLAPILRHKNYIRVNGKPLLIVYRTTKIPDLKATAQRWRQYCQEIGIGDLYLVATMTSKDVDPREINFDAAVEFPPNNLLLPEITHLVRVLNPEYWGRVIRYADVVQHMLGFSQPGFKLYKTIFPMWDNQARRLGGGETYAFSSPDLYREWLEKTCLSALQDDNPEQRLVFINAWNEWAEGAHLEPDRRYGYAYLQATVDALRNVFFSKKSNIK
jgi:hypothetical protein